MGKGTKGAISLISQQCLKDGLQVREMNVPEGFKQTEVGVIPQDWDIDDIQNLCAITTGDKNTQDRIAGGAYPFFVRSQIVERINSYSFDGEAVLTAGDGVGTGRIFHYINGKFDFHQRVYKMSNFSSRLSGYYFFQYFSNHFYNRIAQMTAKSSVDSVRKEMIGKMLIPLPPPAEQTAIAAALSDMDALIDGVEKLLEKKRRIKQGAMQELLSPKEVWETRTLKNVGVIITGGTPSTSIKDYWNGKTPWVTPTDITEKKDIYRTEREITATGLSVIRRVPKDSLLVTCIASIGKNAILRKEGACNQQINAIVPNPDFDVEFLYYLIEDNKNKLISNSGITATLILSKKKFSELQFSFPETKSEQTAIAAILSDMDAEIEQLETQLIKYRQLKTGMMQELLTGKKRLV